MWKVESRGRLDADPRSEGTGLRRCTDLGTGLSEPLATGGAQVAVEGPRLTFCDTAGINAYRRAQESGTRIVFLRPSEQVRRLLTVTGLSERLPIHDGLPAGDGTTA